MTSSHQCLDHVHPLCPEQVDALEDVDLALGRGLLREDVDGDESPCPTDARTAETHKQTQLWYFSMLDEKVHNYILFWIDC